MKDSNEVVQEFNEIVNMTSPELEEWLKSDDARSAGWPKEDESGESVGHDSGRKIVDILKSNPNKDPEKYTDDQISHMRKVVSYCKRHLAQEKKMHETKSNEEVKQSKSYASLKNWGHDPLKGEDGKSGGDEGGDEDAEANEDGDTQENSDDQQTGDKRKKDTGAQAGANKKRETRQGKASTNGSKKKDNDDEDEDENDDDDDGDQDANGKEDGDDEEGYDGQEEEGDESGNSGKKPKKGPKPGDKVSWAWGGGHPEGKVLDVKGDTATVTTKRGNKVSRHGDPEDPAVVLDTGKSKAIKHNHELD